MTENTDCYQVFRHDNLHFLLTCCKSASTQATWNQVFSIKKGIYLFTWNKQKKREANNKVDSEQTEISEANYKEKSKEINRTKRGLLKVKNYHSFWKKKKTI